MKGCPDLETLLLSQSTAGDFQELSPPAQTAPWSSRSTASSRRTSSVWPTRCHRWTWSPGDGARGRRAAPDARGNSRRTVHSRRDADGGGAQLRGHPWPHRALGSLRRPLLRLWKTTLFGLNNAVQVAWSTTTVPLAVSLSLILFLSLVGLRRVAPARSVEIEVIR